MNLKHLLETHSEVFHFVSGDQQKQIKNIHAVQKVDPHTGCFVSKEGDFLQAIQNRAGIIFLIESLKTKVNLNLTPAQTTLLTCKNAPLGMALVLKNFDRRELLRTYSSGISPYAHIHPSATIGKRVSIAPNCHIGPNTFIADDVTIGPNCVIEGECKIGQGTLLHSQVYLGSQTEVGEHCILQPFCSIASDGYGYASTNNGILKIAQIGKVVIEDHVEIGSNSCIDRATLEETRIGFGTKIDNLVHIAHNCIIGRYCFITAGFAMAGSSTIGDFFMCGGTCAVGDHVNIAKNVTLAGASVVTGHILEPGSYGGNPVQPMADYLKTRSSVGQLPAIRKQLKQIIKHLGLSDSGA